MAENPEIKAGDVVVFVTKRSTAMDVERVENGIAYCAWENKAGERVEERAPLADFALFNGRNDYPE